LKSLQTKMLVFFNLLILLGGLSLSYIIYTNATQLVTSSIGLQARQVAEKAQNVINLSDFEPIAEEAIKNAGNKAAIEHIMASPTYRDIREKLNQYREMNGLKYLYTMAEVKPGTYAYIIDGAPFTDTKASAPGEIEENTYERLIAAFQTKQTQIGELDYDEKYGATIATYVPLINASGKMVGIVGADFDATAIYQSMTKQKQQIMAITLGMLVLALLMTYFFSRFLLHPLRVLTSRVQKMQDGDLTVYFHSKSKDEIGELGRAFSAMVADLNTMIKGIQESSRQLMSSSHELTQSKEIATTATEQMVTQVDELKKGADEQLHIVQNVNHTIQHMSEKINKIAGCASEVHQSSINAVQLATSGRNEIDRAVQQMRAIETTQAALVTEIEHLERRSQEIDEIIVVITQIAKQTNLLALNAAIEAARAGESGKGFAVVANEVRKLADQSGKAAQHISQLIQDIQKHTKQVTGQVTVSTAQISEGATVINRSGDMFVSIARAIDAVTTQIKDVTAFTRDVTSNSQMIVQSVSRVERIATRSSQATGEVLVRTSEQQAIIEEFAAAADELTMMANHLHQFIQKFKV
jgi:methyl-accepting chemotaxis protein